MDENVESKIYNQSNSLLSVPNCFLNDNINFESNGLNIVKSETESILKLLNLSENDFKKNLL